VEFGGGNTPVTVGDSPLEGALGEGW